MDPISKVEIATNEHVSIAYDGMGAIVTVKGVGIVILANQVKEIVIRKKDKEEADEVNKCIVL